MNNPRLITRASFNAAGRRIGVDLSRVPLTTLRAGLLVELEHGRTHPNLDVTHDSLIKTLQIVVAHLLESPNYYVDLKQMERRYGKHK